MNVDLIDRNTMASQNGLFCEEYAKRMFPGLVWKDELCDAEYGNVPVDIKGCEAWYARNDMPNATRRAGRFTLLEEQHAELMEKGGFYLFIIHIGELIVKSILVSASKIPFHRQVSWPTVQRLAGVV